MADIFLSYSREDRAAVEPLAAQIAAAGYSVWWDRQLTGGKRYLDETEAELNAAKVVLVVWSKTSIASHWVADEAGAGRDTGRLLPISLDGSMPPLGFRQFQVIDCSKWARDDSAAFAQLTSALGKLTAPSGAASATPNKKPAAKPLLKQPAVLGGIAAAAAALVAVIGFIVLAPKPPQAAAQLDQRTAFFGFVAADRDDISEKVAGVATDETFAAMNGMGFETAARGETQDIAPNAQLAKAATLGARYALSGGVRTEGDTVTVTIRLDDSHTRATLWQKTLTGGARQRDSLPVQAAASATNLLQCLIHVRPAMLRDDAAALGLVTRACDADSVSAIQRWRDVLQVAPKSGYAQLGIGQGFWFQAGLATDADRPAVVKEARDAADRALAADPTLVRARSFRAMIDIAVDRSLAELQAETDAAFQDRSSRSTSLSAATHVILLTAVGRNAEAARISRPDAAAYPLDGAVQFYFATALINSGQGAEGRHVLESTNRRLPTAIGWPPLAAVTILAGEDLAPVVDAAPPGVTPETIACWQDVAKAMKSSASAKAAAARRLLGCMRTGGDFTGSAIVPLAQLGDLDAAFAVASQTLTRSRPTAFLFAGPSMFSPYNRPMRADPRFLPLIKREGIYQYWLDTKTQPDVCEAPEERNFEVCRELRKDQGK